MTAVIALALIVGIAVVLWGVQTLTGKATNAASRAVFNKSYTARVGEMHRTLTFTAPTSVKETGDKIVAVVNAHETAPAVAGGLYLSQRSENLIVFAVGNKMNTAFRARVDLRASEAGSTSGSYRMIDWKESGAQVRGSDSVDRLIGRVSQAVRELGGNTVEGSAP